MTAATRETTAAASPVRMVRYRPKLGDSAPGFIMPKPATSAAPIAAIVIPLGSDRDIIVAIVIEIANPRGGKYIFVV